jgi:hypothetical protein|tara:strand:+ start:7124 stop:7345 length:222 start_codon:yes stop_codon:yes gene_type:complete
MIDVHIYDSYTDDNCIKTKIPIIPKIGEEIGLYINGDWYVFEVTYVLPMLNRDNTFNAYWITLEGNFEEIKRM